MGKDANLVAGIDAIAHNAEKPEDLKVFFLEEHEGVLLVYHASSQLAHQMISHAVFDQEVIVLKKFLQKIEVAGLVHHHHVLDHKIDPLWHVDLEEEVIAYQFVNDLIDGVVELIEFLQFSNLAVEDIWL